jgi:hypothetical protein
MTRLQKIGVVISVLWLIGLPIYLIVHSGDWKTVGYALIVGNSTSWSMMLGPVVLFVSIGVITLDTECPSAQVRSGGFQIIRHPLAELRAETELPPQTSRGVS